MDKEFWWDLIINLEGRKQELESQLPSITSSEFDEYTMIVDLLGPLYKWIPKLGGENGVSS